MSVHDSTAMMSKGASVKLLADMLKQAEEDKKLLREALERVSELSDEEVRGESPFVRLGASGDIARAALDATK